MYLSFTGIWLESIISESLLIDYSTASFLFLSGTCQVNPLAVLITVIQIG